MSARGSVPRVVMAGTGSGVGKTTAAAGLVRALRARGLGVAVFKAGPDYLDPTYLSRAAGRGAQNLDSWMMGRDALLATFDRGARGADLAVVEGMMGLFDGALADGEAASTAEVAKWLEAPVLLVVDASGMARTVAAVAHGFAHFDPDLRLAGLVCNGAGSRGHLDLLRRASRAAPVLGGLPRSPEPAFPERHLGLLPADPEVLPERVLEELGRTAEEWLDLDRILDIARSAPPLSGGGDPPAGGRAAPRCRIGVARDEAFHFYYEDNLARLESLGAALVRFSPIHDSRLPDVEGIFIGGGYPELFAEALAGNREMRDSIRRFAERGGVIYAECGGLMYLSAGIRTWDGRFHPMAGLVPGEARMADRIQALGYVEARTRAPSILGGAGLGFRGHQFRYSRLEPAPPEGASAYLLRPPGGGEERREGYSAGNILASYVHAHWASRPAVAEGLVASCAKRSGKGNGGAGL